MKCNVCDTGEMRSFVLGVKDFEYETYHPVDYEKCAACGVLMQNPLPPASLVPAFYPASYRNYLKEDGALFSFLKCAQEYLFVRFLEKEMEANRGIQILEIGCGNGALLRALGRRGFTNLSGCDFSGSTWEEPYIRFRATNVETEFPFEEQFDAILMVNVIEHFLNPVAVLETCRDHLTPGGKLIIITPHADSLALRVFGLYWAGFHAPRHVYVFTKKSLEAIAEKLYLQKRTFCFTADVGQWSLSVQNILQNKVWARTTLTNGLAWYVAVVSMACIPIAFLQNLMTVRGAGLFYVFEKHK